MASFGVGQSSVDIDINPINDGLAEGSETVTLTLSEQDDYDINTSSSAASVTIFDKFNIINGNGSRDPLIGTAGNDRITGGTGSKTIRGGTGNDEFVYTNIREVGQRIADFTVGSDQIVLTSLLDSLANDVYYNGYNGSDAIADGFVRLVQGSNSNSTIVQIDRDGPVVNGYYGSNAIFRNFIELDNVTPQALNNSNSFVF
ncbi:type I secretion C-terminal target domain-containing protein [Nostocaceae cyanobacterium CENA369]|uniref:Type I secretion C-terminal target domain-containing protein n=1 Tax=Dendronalium phyllosphericum CENA369 TaxID=1725256 RepID=A0A8J7ICI3_9NOST|nr:type I secretion C-terminal target domain-containing protein [Dendronalium phyllosphericum CENA369]